MKNILISAENITKSYLSGKAKLNVLNNVSFEIARGEMVVLLGASGSGKSTLLNILAGIDKPESGKVFIENSETTSYSDDDLADKRNRSIGFVFQFHHLLGDFTILENVMMPSLIAGTDHGIARTKAVSLLGDVGMLDRASHRPGEVSGGEAQRVAMARALINEPALVLADEPTGNLDRSNGEKLMALMFELNQKRGLTFLIATHNVELLGNSRRLVLVDGRISEN